MTSLLTINHYVNQANTFVADVRDKSGSYYVFVARPNPWTNANGDIDDTQTQAVNNSVTQIELDTFNDLLYGKLIGSTDVSQATRRVNWIANTIYSEYDAADEDLYDKNFFVVTTGAGDQYNVYKCLYNNAGAPSTIKPTMQSIAGTFTTGDGYVWKFMYSVDAAANTKFTTSGFIPVTPNSTVQSAAVPGTIDIIKVLDGGSGYNVFETGELQTIVDRNIIKIAANSSTANDYYSGSSIYLKSGFGAGQVRQITDYDGSSKNLVISDPIDLFIKLDISNTANIVTGGADVGQIASQTTDNIQYTYTTGYFNPGANIIQTDTGVAGRILSVNATDLVVSKFDKTLTFSNAYAFRATADTGTRMTNKVTVTTTGALSNNAKRIVFSGSGYASNATVTIVANGTGSGAAANAFANSTGRIQTLFVTASGSNYILEPIVTVSPPITQTFNANAIVTNAIAISTANRFIANDLVTYSRLTGGANIGISNGSYYVKFANTTHISLSITPGGANIALTNTGVSDTNHTIQGQTATVLLYPDTLYAVNATAGAVFTTDYAVNNFIRVGENANVNIRRIMSVNSTIIVVNLPFTVSSTSANGYKMNTAAEPVSNITVTTTSAAITNTNLTSVKLLIANSLPSGESFIVGESVDYVSTSNVSLGANGIVAYTNSSVMFISSVSGVWSSGNRVRGAASEVVATVISVSSNPNVIVKNPNGVFVIGYPVDFTSTVAQGSATLIDASSLTSGVLEYEIGPTVSVTGDGTGAIAVARVDVSNNSSNSVNEILVVNTGSYYTQANITITSNTSFGSGANAYASISPLLGHGADPAAELGARYIALNAKFQNSQTEEWKYPTSVSFRKVGIMKDPLFANVEVSVQSFDRTTLSLSDTVGSWSNGEVVLQRQTSANATGVVITGSASTLNLKQVKGTFNTSNNVVGLSSGSTANVTSAQVVVFASNTVLTQDNTGATAIIASTESNTTLHLANVQGQFTNNLVVYAGNAYATVNAITRADGTNETSNFGLRFNQTSRVTLESNAGLSFVPYEFVAQGTARGRVIATTSDLDLLVADGTSFASSDTITNSNTGATAKATFANSTYIKLTGLSNVAAFSVGQTINNGSTSTTISNLYSVLVLSDITKGSNFTANTTQLVGSSANSLVRIASQPDIVRESGKVIYTEASNTVIARTLNSTEEVRLIVKF
jgi:hypothetical protein